MKGNNLLIYTYYKCLFISLISSIRRGYTPWFSKTSINIWEKGKRTNVEESREAFPKVVMKEQFINERQSIRSINISPQLVQQSQQVKAWTKPSTPRDQLSLEPTSSPLKKRPHTFQWIMVMEGSDEDMEADNTT